MQTNHAQYERDPSCQSSDQPRLDVCWPVKITWQACISNTRLSALAVLRGTRDLVFEGNMYHVIDYFGHPPTLSLLPFLGMFPPCRLHQDVLLINVGEITPV